MLTGMAVPMLSGSTFGVALAAWPIVLTWFAVVGAPLAWLLVVDAPLAMMSLFIAALVATLVAIIAASSVAVLAAPFVASITVSLFAVLATSLVAWMTASLECLSPVPCTLPSSVHTVHTVAIVVESIVEVVVPSLFPADAVNISCTLPGVLSITVDLVVAML